MKTLSRKALNKSFRKKRLSPVVVMLILVAVAFVGVLLGFFDPKLVY